MVQISSCGFFDTRKATAWSTSKQMHTMDKSLYIEELSIDDNRNIKKLYSIIDLARQKQSLDSFIINLRQAYSKLSTFHKRSMISTGVMKNKWIAKNRPDSHEEIDEMTS